MSVLAVEYPGFGANFYRGVATQENILKDAVLVMKYVTEKITV
jgi:hypothetical protein